MTDGRLIGSTEACKTLGIARSTLSQWLEKGWITPAEQLGSGAYVFTAAEVERVAKLAKVPESSAP